MKWSNISQVDMKLFSLKQAKLYRKWIMDFFKMLRYPLLSIIAVFGYWFIMAVMQAGLETVFTLSSRHSYLIAMLISWLSMAILLFRRNDKKHKQSLSYQLYQQTKEQKFSSGLQNIQQVEHTPDYQDYQPKFQ